MKSFFANPTVKLVLKISKGLLIAAIFAVAIWAFLWLGYELGFPM